MKNVILSVLIILFVMNVAAQEKGKIRVGAGLDLALPNDGGGVGGNLDIRYNILDNVNAGIKFTGAILMKDLYINETAQTASITTSLLSSTLVTSDYYFSKGTSLFASFVGGGLGMYKIMNLKMTATGDTPPTTVNDFSPYIAENKFGALIRGGFEVGHFRLGLEYYLVPKSRVLDITNANIGTTSNSYLNFNLGFYFGGGRWKK